MEEYPPDGDVALVISVMEGNIRSPITVVSLVPRPVRLGTRLYCSIVYHRVIGGPGARAGRGRGRPAKGLDYIIIECDTVCIPVQKTRAGISMVNYFVVLIYISGEFNASAARTI